MNNNNNNFGNNNYQNNNFNNYYYGNKGNDFNNNNYTQYRNNSTSYNNNNFNNFNNFYNYNNNNYNNNNNNTNNSSNTLTCTIHEDEDYGVVTIYLDSYNKVKSATATITFYDIEDAKTLAETLSMLEIDFYRNGSTVTVDDYLELGREDLVGKSKTNAKSAMQSEGFTCY